MKSTLRLALVLWASALCLVDAASIVYFSDTFEAGTAHWTLEGTWGLTTSNSYYYSATHALTDSPNGKYTASTDTRARLNQTIDLRGTTAPVLTFWQRYSLGNYDYAYVQVSTDGGFTWTTIESYSGEMRTWNQELIDLKAYKAALFMLRFRVDTNSDTDVGDGWHIDDVCIQEKDAERLPFPWCEDFELPTHTLSAGWGLTAATSHSPTHSLTDTPTGSYAAYTDARAVLAHPIDLMSATKPVLSFWQRYSLGDYDYAYLEVSTDGGFNWKRVESYSGQNLGWHEERVDLSEYKSTEFTARFRLEAGSDSSVADGWYIDDVCISGDGVPCQPPTAPTLSGGTTVNEGTTLSVVAHSTHPDPAQTIAYSLSNAPAGMTISATTGQITWTPTETQGPGDYEVTVIATACTPAASSSSTFVFHADEINVPPNHPIILDQYAVEETLFTYQLVGSDQDLPANTLTFALVSGPAGLTVSGAGLLRWTPQENQGPCAYTVLVSITDYNPAAVNSQHLSVTASLVIVVQEANRKPTLTVSGPAQVYQGQLLDATAVATDSDLACGGLPLNTLRFTLTGAPSGMSIQPDSGVSPLSGHITWVANAPGVHNITVQVNDDANPSLSDTKLYTVEVISNTRPTITAISAQELDPDTATPWIPFTIGDRETLADQLVVTATSSNTLLVPADHIFLNGAGAQRYVLVMPKRGESGRATITVTVTDAGGLTASTMFEVVVCPGGPEIVQQPADQVAEPGDTVTFTVVANGKGTLTYQWYHEGQPISSATADALVLLNVTIANVGAYTVVVSDGVCKATSAAAHLRLVPELECDIYAVITVHGIPGHRYLLQYSESNQEPFQWNDLGWILLEQSPQLFIDMTSTARTARIYRAIRQP